MNQRQHVLCDLAAAIRADEVGLEYGVYGDYRLRCTCQPIYSVEANRLKPVAVEAFMEAHRAGEVVPWQEFFFQLPERDRPFVESLYRALHIRNYFHIGLDGGDLFLNYNPSVEGDHRRALAEMRFMAQRLGDYGLHSSRLVCEIGGRCALDDTALLSMVREMRRNGLRVAIDDFGIGQVSEAWVRLLEPDIVRIDGGWFKELCRHFAAEKLFRPLLSLLHDQGVQVLVEGIEQPAQLGVALEAGADLLQGLLLARPVLTGTLFSAEPLEINELLRPAAKVIPLFG